MLEFNDHVVRLSVAQLINKINELGLIQLIESAKIFIKMLNDSNYKAYCIANNSLKRLI